MQGRLQRTIQNSVETRGVGFVTGRDVVIRFHPAEPNHGVQFRRTDCHGSSAIPARIEFAVPRRRRTAIEREGTSVELIEHVMAALAGLRVDNCLIELNAPEPPGLDGSSLEFARLLLDAGIVEQSLPRRTANVGGTVFVGQPTDESEITFDPRSQSTLRISYSLDYGPRSPIIAQKFTIDVTPESFVREMAFARTFLLTDEAEALRAAGYGSRTGPKDLLIFGPGGPIENELRAPDECARHKALDCLGDFALLGCDIFGHFSAYRSGHDLNREMVRKLVARSSLGTGHAGRAA